MHGGWGRRESTLREGMRKSKNQGNVKSNKAVFCYMPCVVRGADGVAENRTEQTRHNPCSHGAYHSMGEGRKLTR